MNKNHIVLKDDGKGEYIAKREKEKKYLKIISIIVPYGLLVWSTGLMRNPLIESFSEAKKDESGQR